MDTYGIIGYPIKHSLSPAMHNAAFKKLGIDAEYRKFEVQSEELEDFLLNRKDVKGFNITIPHKVRAKEILEKKFPIDRSSDEFEESYYVEVTGAVNTVKRNGNELRYCNTDVEGFLMSLKRDLKFDIASEKKSVLLIGCGGAGRAIIAGLSLDFEDSSIEKIYIYDKEKEAVDSAKDHFSKVHKKWLDNLKNATEFISEKQIPDVIKGCQLLVNSSPVGMKEGDISVVNKELLHNGIAVYDVVYNRETELVKEAKLLGRRAVGGRGMLLYQGVGAFEFWFPRKRPRPVATMKKALWSNLGGGIG